MPHAWSLFAMDRNLPSLSISASLLWSQARIHMMSALSSAVNSPEFSIYACCPTWSSPCKRTTVVRFASYLHTLRKSSSITRLKSSSQSISRWVVKFGGSCLICDLSRAVKGLKVFARAALSAHSTAARSRVSHHTYTAALLCPP